MLLGPERDQRIDPGGTPGRHPAGYGGHGDEGHAHHHESQDVRRAHTVNHPFAAAQVSPVGRTVRLRTSPRPDADDLRRVMWRRGNNLLASEDGGTLLEQRLRTPP